MELAKQMTMVVKKMDAHFTFKGRPVTPKEMFSDVGLMPGLMKRAEQLSSLCLGKELGAEYEDIEDSLLGSKIELDDSVPNAIRIFCLVDVLYELVKTSHSQHEVSLDELMYD